MILAARRLVLRSALAVALLSCATARAQEEAPLPIADDIDAFMEDIGALIAVEPGVAVAVYTPDGVYARGFGLANIDSGERATADTAFYIASSTKSFNALAMNVLHHRGELDLDATLAEFAPDAPFPDSVRPDEATLRDLLTHASGVANGPVQFRSAFSGDHTPELMWSLLGSSVVNEEAPLGVFQYTNVGYNILTVLTDRKLGVPWQDLVAREILEPVGMTRTTAYMSQAEREGWSVARPLGLERDGRSMRRLYLEKVDATMQSAGGMVMSANDALLWLELLVNDGRVDGEQIVPAQAVQETRARLVAVDQTFNGYVREDYGLGWYVSSYGGDVMIHHFGGFSGFRAHVSYLPERQVGAAVFVNEAVTGSWLADATANYVYDRLSGREEGAAARAAIVQALAARHRESVDGMVADLDRRAARDWTLSQPLTAYEGTYVSPEMGTLTLSVEDGALIARIGVMHAVAEPFTAPDTVRVELAPNSGSVLAFEIEDGVAGAVSLNDARFERSP